MEDLSYLQTESFLFGLNNADVCLDTESISCVLIWGSGQDLMGLKIALK